MKYKELFKNWRIRIFIILVIVSIILIHPRPWATGVAIKGVTEGSPAALAGITFEKQTSLLTKIWPGTLAGREVITKINDQNILTSDDYYKATESFKPGDSIFIETNKNSYFVKIPELSNLTQENATNQTTANTTQNQNITQVLTTKDVLGLHISPVSTSNINTGLDLQGGTRILLEPSENLTADTFAVLAGNVEKRLNIYGLSDVRISVINDAPIGGRPQYLLVEIAGVSLEEIQSLISSQGKFEAKIANQTVFSGAEIKPTVSSGSTMSGVDLRSCGQVQQGQFVCRYSLPVTLNVNAAKRFAQMTQNLQVVTENGERYLDQKLELYLDDQLITKLGIVANLRGQQQTDISITGSGSGGSMIAAQKDAAARLKEMEVLLKTGDLPSKLTIVRSDTISATLGKTFIDNAFLVAILSIIGVVLLVFLRYHKLKISIPMIITCTSEVILILGFAALVGWNIDLAAIAGIIIIIGTGIDAQIIVADEAMSGEHKQITNWRSKTKKALGIILISYLTAIVAMIPLIFTGAGLLKGFALTTIVGVTLGIAVTRPAFAAMIEILLDDN